MGYGGEFSLGDEVDVRGWRGVRAGPKDMLALDGLCCVHCWLAKPESVPDLVRSERYRWAAGAGDAVDGAATPPAAAAPAAEAVEAVAPRAERGQMGPSDEALRESLGLETDETTAKKDIDTAADISTLWVDYDNQGERYKSWRDMIRESSQEAFPDTPLEGPGAKPDAVASRTCG
ncbi:unnamed protein product [Prorocentrum cordatum]|uniref:Uncharacterized protein n=1 Tax=Prorocentrum cordatum TaxID=2364126 RepID=A0ABN9RFD1_9DINO|nr:unnamed protein product [Polarella glacialis]